MLRNIIETDTVVSAIWHELEQCQDAYDRILWKNLTSDLRLQDPQFSEAVAPTRGDIVEFFRRWHQAYHANSAPERALCQAHQEVAAKSVGWSYYNLFLLGYDTTELSEEHCGQWVSFFKYRAPRETTIDAQPGEADAYRLNKDAVTASIRSSCCFKKMVWVACHGSLTDDINNCQLDGNYRVFDTIRDRVGLEWSPAELGAAPIPVIGLVITLGKGDPLTRVPTFFDSCGYPFFRPPSADWLERHRCGCTFSLSPDPKKHGVGELVVWVGDGPPPSHTGTPGTKRDDWTVLEDNDGKPLIFAVQSKPNLGDYPTRRV